MRIVDFVWRHRDVAIILTAILSALIYISGRFNELDQKVEDAIELIVWRNSLPCG
jgi:hypothetical protein